MESAKFKPAVMLGAVIPSDLARGAADLKIEWQQQWQ
jgi:hypothetical protein